MAMQQGDERSQMVVVVVALRRHCSSGGENATRVPRLGRADLTAMMREQRWCRAATAAEGGGEQREGAQMVDVLWGWGDC